MQNWGKREGRWLFISFWKSLRQQDVLTGFFTNTAVYDLHKDDGGGIGHRRTASQRATSFHIPGTCSCLRLP